MPRLTICFVLVLATVVVFSPVRHHDYVDYDDPDYVQKNSIVQRGLTWEGVKWAFTTDHMSNWHPLTWLSHMIDCRIHGKKPGGHHVTSVLVHAANALLLFLLLGKLTGTIWRSAFVAGLFALHPLHVESVAWIAERKDVLSTFFGLLALLSYIVYARLQPETPKYKFKRNSFYILTLFLFSFSLMSKPMLVTLPFVLLLLDFWPLQRFSNLESQDSTPINVGQASCLPTAKGKKDQPAPELRPGKNFPPNTPLPFRVFSYISRAKTLLLEKLPFLLLTIASCIVTYKVQAGKTVQSLQNFSLLDRFSNVSVTYVIYIWKTIWPAKLAFFYPLVKAPPLWQSGLATLFLITTTIVVLRFVRRAPYAAVGWFWYLGTLVPVIGFVHVGEQSHADRYTYIPSIGLFLFFTWAVAQILTRRPLPKIILAVPAVSVFAVFATVTWKQLDYWKNNRVMLERALAVTKDNFVACNNYGNILADEGRLDEAIQHYAEAIRIKPLYARAYDNYGSALTLQGKYDEAIEKFLLALQYRPEARTHHNLAVTLARQKKYEETIIHCREALRLNPDFNDVYYDLGLALHLSGDSQQAVTSFEKFLQENPGDALAHFYMASAFIRQGKIVEAIPHYRQTIRFQPDFADAYSQLAWLLATHAEAGLRNGPEAVKLAEEASRLTNHQQPFPISVLAAAYAESGQFDKAMQNAQHALTIAEQLNRPSQANIIRQQLQLYQDGKPCRIK